MQNILKSKIFISAVLAVAAIAAAVVIGVSASRSGSDLQAQLDLGEKYISELDYENAVIAYEEALEIDPYCLDAYLGLSDAYMALGQQDKAIEIMEQAKAMLPDSVEVYVSLAQLYASQEKLDLVVSTLEAGIQATNSDRLREMLQEYLPGEEAPVQVAENGQEEAVVEEQSSQTQEEEEEAPSLAIGLEQDNRNQNQAPVLVIARNDEEPARIPLIAPEPQPAVTESADNGTVNDENAGSSSSGSGENQDSGSGSGSGSNGGGSDDPPEIVEPVLPTTGITGNIYGIDGQGIEGVTISVYSGNSETPVLVNTDTIGKYLQELSAGSYRIVLSKDGYADLSTLVSVTNDALTSSSYIMLTEEESRQSASLKGVAINATDSQNVEGATIVLINGFDNGSNGDPSVIESNKHTTTGSDGRFSLDDDVTAGYYTIEASKDGYSTYIHNETIKPGENDLAISMSPVIQTQGEYRIVLTWGEYPRDLDSHLICTGNDNYHVYFGNKNSDDGNASLDRDDVTSYGPETTTVKIGAGNSYIYAVHNFSNGGSRPGQSGAWNLANSGARVVVYADEGIIFDGNVPVNKEGTTWEVFRIENGRLVVKNSVSFEHPRELAGDYSLMTAENHGVAEPAALTLMPDEPAVVSAEIQTEEMVSQVNGEKGEAVTEDTVDTEETITEETMEPEEVEAEELSETDADEPEEIVVPEDTSDVMQDTAGSQPEEDAATDDAESEGSTELEEVEAESGEPESEGPTELEEVEAESGGPESEGPTELEEVEAEPGEPESEGPTEAEEVETAEPEETGTADSEKPEDAAAGEDETEETTGIQEPAETEDGLLPEDSNVSLESKEPAESEEKAGNSENEGLEDPEENAGSFGEEPIE